MADCWILDCQRFVSLCHRNAGRKLSRTLPVVIQSTKNPEGLVSRRSPGFDAPESTGGTAVHCIDHAHRLYRGYLSPADVCERPSGGILA